MYRFVGRDSDSLQTFGKYLSAGLLGWRSDSGATCRPPSWDGDMRIELSCAACGENRFDLHENHADDAFVCCTVCGHEIGTLAELKERVAVEVLRRAAKQPNASDPA